MKITVKLDTIGGIKEENAIIKEKEEQGRKGKYWRIMEVF